MNFLEHLNRFVGLYLDLFKSLRRPVIWLPFLVYAGFQFLLLLLLVNSSHPGFHGFLSPLVGSMEEARLLSPGSASVFDHYPGLFVVLPSVFQWFKIVLGMVLEGLVIGLGAVLFIRYFVGVADPRTRVALAFRRWPQLLVVWTLITGLMLLVNLYLPRYFEAILVGSPRRLIVFEILMRLLTVGVYSLFVYAIPALMVRNGNILAAFKTSLGNFFRRPIFSFCLVLVPFLISLPLSYASGQAGAIVEKFTPELVFYILTGTIIIDIIVNYILTGTVVNFLLDQGE